MLSSGFSLRSNVTKLVSEWNIRGESWSSLFRAKESLVKFFRLEKAADGTIAMLLSLKSRISRLFKQLNSFLRTKLMLFWLRLSSLSGESQVVEHSTEQNVESPIIGSFDRVMWSSSSSVSSEKIRPKRIVL